MSVFRWLGIRTTRKNRHAGAQPSRQRSVLRLEALEDRVVPASVQAISIINPLLVSPGDSLSSRYALSQDGRYVAFESVANNLIAGDTNGASDVFVRDTLLGTITRASTNSAGNQVGGDSSAPAIIVDISGDVLVAFQSSANNLVGDDNNGQADIFVKNLSTGVTTRASTNSAGGEVSGESAKPVMILDGNGMVIVAFHSLAADLADVDDNEFSDIFIKNLSTLQTTRVSTDSTGVVANGRSANPALAVDGTGTMYVAFESDASNLVGDDSNFNGDVFVKNLSTGVISLASTDAAGTQGNDSSAEPALAIDVNGHVLVAFSSNANNLIGDDSNSIRDVFVKDLNSGVTTCVSTDSNGTQGNGESNGAAIIVDGGNAYVAFHSAASNLVNDDTNSVSDVFIKNIGTLVTSRLSTSSVAAQGDNASYNPALARIGAGEIIAAFQSLASNLVSGDNNAVADVFLKNLNTNATTAVSRVSTATLLLAGSSVATTHSLSKNGRYVAFQSAISDIISGDTNGVADIFVHDTLLGTITRVSTASNGSEANGGSFAPAIAMDNSGVVYVAFHSAASNLVGIDTNSVMDVFVKNLTTGVTVRASTDSSANQANGISDSAALAIDSTGAVYVAFTSSANNLVSGDTNGDADVFVKNLTTGNTSRVSTDGSGIQADGASSQAAVAVDSNTGTVFAAFTSDATNLSAGDSNAKSDVFVKNLSTNATTRVSTSSSAGQGNDSSFDPSVAVNGSSIVFVSYSSHADNLVIGDTNAVSDVFVKNLSNGVNVRASVDNAGDQGNSHSGTSAIAIDAGGNVLVAFESSADNLAAGDTNTASDVFIRNLTTSATIRISTDAADIQADNDSHTPALAVNGGTTFVAYSSLAGNLVVGDDNASSDVFLWQQIVVSAATHFIISVPASTASGSAFNVTVTARDVSNNITSSYNGTIHFTSSDTQAVLPANATLTNGVGNFSITLKSVGNKTITVTDTVTSSLTGTSAAIAVEGPIHFGVGVPASVVAGNVMIVTVTALDEFNGTVTNYSGVVHITSSDTQASLSPNATLINGVGFFAAVLKTAGAQTLLATDTVSTAISGTSGSINVLAAAATSFYVDLPSSSFVAGNGFAFTVTARDLYLNTVTAYSGTVHFASSDAQAVLPEDATLANGTGMFSTVLKTAGNHTLSATDTSTASLTAGGTVTVVPGSFSHFSVALAGTSTIAGGALAFTVTASDSLNNTVSGYSGTVHFTSSDGQAALPANATLNGGTGFFAAILNTAGSQTLFATDTVNTGLTGNAAIEVLATGGPATHFSVSVQGVTTAGNALVFAVTALDAINTTAAGYSGTVHFSSSDSQAYLPGDATLTNGIGYFAAILRTAGTQTITAIDATTASISGASNNVSVSVAALHHLGVVAPSNAITGVPFDFTVAAQDQFNNTISTYGGTVHFASSDGIAVLPADSTLTNGSKVFSATLNTSGSQILTATDTNTATITSPTIVTIATRGLVVTGNTVTPTANGFTASFNKPFDPAPINLYDTNSALGVADVILARNAIQTITFGNSAGFTNGSTFTLAFNSSTTGAITYTTNAATLQINIQNALNALSTLGSGNSLVTASSATSVTVMFQGARGFQAVSLMTAVPSGATSVLVGTTVGGSSNLRGTLLLNSTNTELTFLLSSTGPGGVLPADVYQATIRSASNGFKDLLGASLDGNNDGVTGDSMVTTFTVATTPTVILSIPDFARGPDSIYNVRIPNGPGGEEIQTITFTGTANGSTFNLVFSGQTASGITYSTSAATLQSNIQNALDALSNISGPSDFNFRRADVLVTATDASNVTVRFQNVMGGFDQPQITATSPSSTVGTGTSSPGTNTGIPISLQGGNLGAGVTAMTFDLLYNPALLNITGTYSLAGGSSFTLVGTPSGGTAHFSYNRNAAPALGATATLGHIVANVPDSAETNFKTKQLLRLTSIVATGAAAAVTGNNGVQIVAFFGDANGDGRVTGGDAALVSRVSGNTDTVAGTTQVGGLGAYRMLDPYVIIALAGSGNSQVVSGDVTLINSYLVASRTQVPTPPPFTDMALAIVGPDPTLSLPSDLRASAGETVVVPINIDITRPGDSPGMMEAILALRYDTKVFTVSAADIQLGSVPSSGNGWQLRSAVNAETGEIGINIYSMNPILTRGGGSLVTVSLHVREGAVAGTSAINLVRVVNPTGLLEYVTSVNDSFDQYIINPVITDGFDAGVDGRVMLQSPESGVRSAESGAGVQWSKVGSQQSGSSLGSIHTDVHHAAMTNHAPLVDGEVVADVMNEVFGDFEEAALYLAASGLGKSAAQDTDRNNVNSATDDLAMLWTAEGVSGQDWMSDDPLSSLGKSIRRGRRLLASNVEDSSEEAAGVASILKSESHR